MDVLKVERYPSQLTFTFCCGPETCKHYDKPYNGTLHCMNAHLFCADCKVWRALNEPRPLQ